MIPKYSAALKMDVGRDHSLHGNKTDVMGKWMLGQRYR
jgi:hypothetical protein